MNNSEPLQDSPQESEPLQDSRPGSDFDAVFFASLDEAERIAQATFKAAMEERLSLYKTPMSLDHGERTHEGGLSGGPKDSLLAHSFDAKQFKYLGKRAKFEPLQDDHVSRPWGEHHVSRQWREDSRRGSDEKDKDAKNEPDVKRLKIHQRPEDWIDVEGKVVVMCVQAEADDNRWYALSPEDLEIELKPIADRFPNPDCKDNMFEYLRTVRCIGDKTKSAEQQDEGDAMAALLASWEKKYRLPEGTADIAGRLRQLWKPFCIVSVDLHE